MRLVSSAKKNHCLVPVSFPTETHVNSLLIPLSLQGYHDILSIILLTLNPTEPPSIVSERTESPWDSIQDRDLTLKACERISLHFVRDSMTENMDPVMGQLK